MFVFIAFPVYMGFEFMAKLRKKISASDSPLPEKETASRFSFPIALLYPSVWLRWAGSLGVALVFMSVLLVILVWTTFVETCFGAPVASFAVYGSHWFAALLVILALNILCSAITRLPWKPRHLPFLFAHLGILILLTGCALTWQWGEEATLSLFEGKASSIAKKNEQCFEVRFIPMVSDSLASDFTASGRVQSETERPVADAERVRDTQAEEKIVLPFTPGPFRWEEYQPRVWFHENADYSPLLTVPLRWAMLFGKRDSGVLKPIALKPTDNAVSLQGATIEVIDYYANSSVLPAVPLELSVRFERAVPAAFQNARLSDETDASTSGGTTTGDSPDPVPRKTKVARNWEAISLRLPLPSENTFHSLPTSVRTTLSGGERIVYYTTDIQEEVEAFRNSQPTDLPKSGAWGQIVLSIRGRTYPIDVWKLMEGTENRVRYPLGNSGYTVEMLRIEPRGPVLWLNVTAPNGTSARIVLFADRPEMNVHAKLLGVFGTYWFSPRQGGTESDSPQSGAPNRPGLRDPADPIDLPRIDLLQGPDRKLYYRYWTGQSLVSSGEILTQPGREGALISRQLSFADGTPAAVELTVDQYVPCDLSGYRIAPAPVLRNSRGEPARQMAKLRLRMDGITEEFWIRAMLPTMLPQPPGSDQVHYHYTADKTIRIVWDYRQLDLDFGLYLKKFEQKTEPGTRHDAAYSSLVDQIRFNDAHTGATGDPSKFEVLRSNVPIRMNQPGVFRGTTFGRAYRFYQSGRSGPFRPGDPRFAYAYDGTVFPGEKEPREAIYMSTFSVNYDPGRGLKYLGSFLLILGIAWLIAKRPVHVLQEA